MVYMRLLKIYGHFRFAFVHCRVLGVRVSPEEGAVRVRWQFLGLGALRLAALYVPRQLWRRENFKEAAQPWQDGVSTFYVGADGLVKRHVADDKEEDRGQAQEDRLADRIRAKLAKLKKSPDVPAPAM